LASSPYQYYGTEAIIFQDMATITQRFGSRVRRLREQRKVSQQSVASKANLDLTTVNEIENGNREPMLRTIWKLANALEVKVKDLFDF